MSSTRWFCQLVSAKATPNATSDSTRRLRSSPRWSTTERRSSWEMGLTRRTTGAGLGLLLAGRRLGTRGLVGPVRQLVAVLVLLVARQRVLELAHAGAERAPEVGQTLRAEQHQDQNEDDQDLGQADAKGHALIVAPRTLRTCAFRQAPGPARCAGSASVLEVEV